MFNNNTAAKPAIDKTYQAKEGKQSKLLPNPKSIEDLKVLSMPEGGVDSLNFIAWDTIEVIGFGEDTVELKGHYKIDRATPTDSDWEKASVDIRMLEMNVEGVSEKFGPIRASVNDDIGIKSQGQVRQGTVYPDIADSPKLCEMEGYMKFEVPGAQMTVFNKEKILLQHKITHIPPIGQGGGTGDVAINLYDVNDPDGSPVAILKRVKTHIGSWKN